MKRQVLVDLILNHYKGDDHAFFRNVLEVLKDFRETNANELADMIEFEISGHYTVLPKKEERDTNWNEKIEFEDAKIHYLIKDGELVPEESEHTGITGHELAEMLNKPSELTKEESRHYIEKNFLPDEGYFDDSIKKD